MPPTVPTTDLRCTLLAGACSHRPLPSWESEAPIGMGFVGQLLLFLLCCPLALVPMAPQRSWAAHFAYLAARAQINEHSRCSVSPRSYVSLSPPNPGRCLDRSILQQAKLGLLSIPRHIQMASRAAEPVCFNPLVHCTRTMAICDSGQRSAHLCNCCVLKWQVGRLFHAILGNKRVHSSYNSLPLFMALPVFFRLSITTPFLSSALQEAHCKRPNVSFRDCHVWPLTHNLHCLPLCLHQWIQARCGVWSRYDGRRHGAQFQRVDIDCHVLHTSLWHMKNALFFSVLLFSTYHFRAFEWE